MPLDDSSVSAATEAAHPQLHTFWKFDLVVFQIENTLFRIPKHGFLQSAPRSPFVAMFAAPPPDPANIEGSSVDNPIILEGTSTNDFEAFLRVLYPQQDYAVLSYKDWVGVLRLAHKWNYDEIREKAIKALAPLLNGNAAEKINQGIGFLVRDWLREGLVDLIQRKDLKYEELSKPPYQLHWETIGKLFSVKYNLLRSSNTQNLRCDLQMSNCNEIYGPNTPLSICRCRAGALVDVAFSAELSAAVFNADNDEDNAPHLQPS